MSSTVLILERDKKLGYFQDDSEIYVIASFWGSFAHSMVLECMWDNRLFEGTVALSNDPCCKSKVLSDKEEYDAYQSENTFDIRTEQWKWDFAYRVEKSFFDNLKQSPSFEEFKSSNSGSHNSEEAKCLDKMLPELDFEHFYYYVLSCGDPQT